MINSRLLLQHNFHGFSVDFFLCLKLLFAFCFLHVFALELTLQENIVRTEEFSRKYHQLKNNLLAEIKLELITSNYYHVICKCSALGSAANYFSNNPTFGIINNHFSCKIVCKSLFFLDFCRKFSQKCRSEKKLVIF